MPSERLDIVISEKGGKQAKRTVEGIGKAGEDSARGLSLLKKALGGLTIGLAIRKAAQLADKFTGIQNKLKAVSNGFDEASRASDRLFEIANKNRTEIDSTVSLYAKLIPSAKQLNASQEDILAVTQAVTQSFKLSGASATESAGGIKQLAQALGSGVLRGDEFNSIAENAPVILRLLSKELGVTTGALRAMAAEGKLTSDVVFSALLANADDLQRRFDQLSPTISGAFTVLQNQLIRFVGEANRASGVGRLLANVIIGLGNNLDVFAGIIFTVAIPAILRLSATWFAFAASNPAILLASVAAAAVVFGANLEVGAAGGAKFFDVFRAGFQIIGEGLTQMAKDSSEAFAQLTEDNGRAAQDFDNPWRIGTLLIAGYMDSLLAGNAALGSSIVTLFSGLGTAIVQLFEFAVNKVIDILNGLLRSLASVAEASNKMFSGFTGIKMPKIEAPFVIPNLGEDTTQTLDDFKNPWASLAADFKSSFEFLRKGGRTGFTVKSFFEEAFREADKAALKIKKIEEERKAANEDSTNAIMNNERGVSNEVEKTLQKLREQVRLFSQTENQKQITRLQDQGAGPDQIAEAESLQKQAQALQQFSDIIGGGTALFNEIIQFQNAATALQSQTAGTAAKVQADASLALAEGSLNITTASQKLFEQVGSFLNSAADLALAEVETKFTTGAVVIAQRVATAFTSAFTTGLTGGLSGILGSLGASLNSGGGVTGPGLNAIGNGGTIDPALKAYIDNVESSRKRVEALKTSIENIGPAASQSFSQASAGAQQFGQNTTNIGQQFNTVFGNAFSSLEGAISTFVTTGKFDFKQLINSMLADLARLVVQMLIIKPLMGIFGGFFGGIFGFAQGGFVGGAGLPGFASGGAVGGFGGSTSDNVLARLSPGEFVVNAASTKGNRGSLEGLNKTGRMPTQVVSGGGVTIVNNVTVNSNGGDGNQIGSDVAKQLDVFMRTQVVKVIRDQMRPGSLLERVPKR